MIPFTKLRDRGLTRLEGWLFLPFLLLLALLAVVVGLAMRLSPKEIFPDWNANSPDWHKKE